MFRFPSSARASNPRLTSAIASAVSTIEARCSVVAAWIAMVASSAARAAPRIDSSASSVRPEVTTPIATRRDSSSAAARAASTSPRIPSISSWIPRAPSQVRSESFRISAATAEKPRPCSPARVARREALRARRLVCRAISSITLTTRPISCERASARRTVDRTLSAAAWILSTAERISLTTAPPSATPSPTRATSRAAFRADSPTWATDSSFRWDVSARSAVFRAIS